MLCNVKLAQAGETQHQKHARTELTQTAQPRQTVISHRSESATSFRTEACDRIDKPHCWVYCDPRRAPQTANKNDCQALQEGKSSARECEV